MVTCLTAPYRPGCRAPRLVIMPTLLARRALVLISGLVVATVVLAGCGDDSGGAARGDAAAVEATLVTHYKSPDCTDLTEKAQKQFGYGPGPNCEKVIDERNPPKDVKVSDVEVDGDGATGVVEGETFVLLRKGTGWIIDGTK